MRGRGAWPRSRPPPAGLTRRLHRQNLNLEEDNLSGAARHQIADRIGQLEADIVARRAITDQLRNEPDGTDREEIAAALDRLLELGGQIKDMPEPELRGLSESLDLQLRYYPDDRAVDIQVTLAGSNKGRASHDRLVPPAGAVTGLRRRAQRIVRRLVKLMAEIGG